MTANSRSIVRKLSGGLLWSACAVAVTVVFCWFLYRIANSMVRHQLAPAALEVIFLGGFAVLAAVFWFQAANAIGGRKLPSPPVLRMTAAFLLLWSLCAAFLALQSQVYPALLWALLGLAMSIVLLARSRRGTPAPSCPAA